MSYKQRHPYLMQIVYIIKYRLENWRKQVKTVYVRAKTRDEARKRAAMKRFKKMKILNAGGKNQ